MSNDPTEMERRRLMPIVNQPAADAVNTANEILVAVVGADTTVTDEEAVGIIKDRDDLAKELLRAKLSAAHGTEVYDTDQLSEHFEVIGFSAPFVVVRRTTDRKKGSLEFTHNPRLYYNFQLYDGS